MKIEISKLKPHPLNEIFGDLPKEEFDALKEDIKKRGLQTIIDITKDFRIVCGHQRIKILQELNKTEVNVRILEGMDEDRIKEHLIKDNVLRRQLTPFQIVEAGKELETIYEGRLGRPKKGGQMSTIKEKGKTRDLVAKDFSITGRTYERYKNQYNQLKEDNREDLIKQEKQKEITLSDIKKIDKEIKIQKQEEDIESGKIVLPKGKFEIIVIDPPWQYGTKYDPKGRRVASPYPEMGIEDIKSIKLPYSDDCVLWLWTTHKFMRHSFEILDKWGFEEKVILTWVKNRIGIGRWLRSQSEFCIMAVKGKPIIKLTNQSTILQADVTTHSEKPQKFYDMVDSLCVGRKLDYFARKERKGWETFGTNKKPI